MILPSSVGTIIAFSFGHRIDFDGRVIPGPVNENLAKVGADLHRQSGALVWAQWEIAEVLAERHQMKSTTVMEVCPSRDPDGNVVYLSTRGVAESIVASCECAPDLGPTIVVAHQAHVDRCVRTCRMLGIDAAKPTGLELPSFYDSESEQP